MKEIWLACIVCSGRHSNHFTRFEGRKMMLLRGEPAMGRRHLTVPINLDK